VQSATIPDEGETRHLTSKYLKKFVKNMFKKPLQPENKEQANLHKLKDGALCQKRQSALIITSSQILSL